MAYKSAKKIPSETDWQVWQEFFLYGKERKQIANSMGVNVNTVDYHISEGKRLIGVNVAEAQDVMKHLSLPVSLNGLRLIDKAFRTLNPKYIYAAVKFLQNTGVTVPQSEITVTLKDSTNADDAFEEVMARRQRRAMEALRESAIDVTPSEPITAPQSDDPPKDDTEPTSSH